MSQDDVARAAILRRRAVFVGSALTALSGCPQPPSAEPRKNEPVVTVEPASQTATVPTGSGVVTRSSATPKAKAVSLEIPEGVNATARSYYEQLARSVPLIHADLDSAEKTLAGICDITDSQCDARWLAFAKTMAAVDDVAQDLGPPCGGTSADAKAFYARLAEHRAAISERKRQIMERVDKLLQDAAAKAKWTAHQAAAAVPQPCLDYSCNDW